MANSDLGLTPTLVLALKAISSLGRGREDVAGQALQASEAMLQGLFRETPTALHPVGLLSHLAYWMQREEAEVRMRAASLSCSLFRFVRQLPSFQNAPEPLFGSVVAQLAVSLLDPVPEIPERAREAASHLYALLLQQPGETLAPVRSSSFGHRIFRVKYA
ncbi:UNVERIFIED_CONTAM: hypothetical protein K2H54_014239 [Gekko kuhli]